ncbi:MAG TPA: NRDE family protein [Rhodanobacteraceae bacterium]|nr:NRDE family protein [Rhodanobacteraceae bacterium]
MCLLLIAINAVSRRPLLLLGNRDEYRARPSAAAAPWSEDSRVVGGRDLGAGGSWLAIQSDGRHAAVTNVRTGLPAKAPKSRGWLVRDFVLGNASPRDFLDAAHADVESYGAFNLVVGDRDGTWAYGTADEAPRKLEDGIHVISNGRIGVRWPKTERLRHRFVEAIASSADDASLLDLLMDESQPADAELPDTGVGIELERMLAPVFVRGSVQYGTRSSALAYFADDGGANLQERIFGVGMRVEREATWRSAASTGTWSAAKS